MLHSCSLTPSGGLECWGSNASGQLGDGTTMDRSLPVAVSGLASGVVAISAGGNGATFSHTCAVTSAGGVSCWGNNSSGQLGDGTTVSSSVPVAVSGLASGVAAISAGGAHTCAGTSAGAALCWGRNLDGQLGDGTNVGSNVPVPVAVSGLASGVAAISAGGSHTCAVTSAGGGLCWGSNASGQLGDGTTLRSNVPVAVSGLASGVAAIGAGGHHTCAVTSAGGGLCWGRNDFGELGDGTTADRSVPVAVSGLSSGVAAISVGDDHTCAVSSAGAGLCWGDNSADQLGDGWPPDSSVPVPVTGLSKASSVAAISAGGDHTCAATSTGGALCWGHNIVAQLGDGTTLLSSAPVAVSGLASGVTAISGGADHSCALTSAGGVLCWGRNVEGQLGDGTTLPGSFEVVPVAVSGLASGVAVISAGTDHTCAVTTAGGGVCWGWNHFGQLGNGTAAFRDVPAVVSLLANGVAAISAGGSHSCAMIGTGGAVCWGSDGFGQLGDGLFMIGGGIPVAVEGFGLVAISAGGSHTCAVGFFGGAFCWGLNESGQLGNQTIGFTSDAPISVSGLSSGVAAISAGSEHTCAVTTAGGALCWGRNFDGQLGDGTTVDSISPVAVSGLSSGVAAIAAGGDHTCALTSAGGALCWGRNFDGQLGDGTNVDRSLPVAVSGLSSGVAAIAAGGDHTCALTSAGSALCWGLNDFGQLGDGAIFFSTVPIPVPEPPATIGLIVGAGFLWLLAQRRRSRVPRVQQGEVVDNQRCFI